jgi:hypothetical protein
MSARFKGRPMDGLPGRLPRGEDVLWQGKPQWRSLAREGFRIRWVAGYFAALILWRIYGSLASGHDVYYAVVSAASCILLGAVCVAMFTGFAWLLAKTTTYTITQKRVVISYGMALPKSLNLPFTKIESADMRVSADGTGSISFRLPEGKRLSFWLLWPHARAGEHGRTQPVFRCITDPEGAADVLTHALAVSALPKTSEAAPALLAQAA